ncbi:MAG TPA: arylesterase [Symbiobacteriaceae bacterium]|jgi:acyl-CoA thioesterase-1
MRKAHIFLLVVFILTLGMAGCGSKAKPAATPAGQTGTTAPTPKPPAPDRTGWPVIVTFGDSLTAGQGVAPERNYPSQLQAALDKQGYKYRVVNAGISGDTSAGALNRVEAVVNQKPVIVILEMGANDGLQGKSVAQMRANLATIIERLQKAGVKLVLAGMEIPPNYGPEYTQAFRESFTGLASQYHVPLIPFFLDGVGGRPDLNLPDGVHPTGDGYVYVVKNVMAVLQPLLTK